jgi:hypothetical protein
MIFHMYNTAQINFSCGEINSSNWSPEIRVKVHDGRQVPAIQVNRDIWVPKMST